MPEDPRVIFEEDNPYGTLAAVLEEDGRTVYLYLMPVSDPNIKPRAVWVRNLLPAPETTDLQAMKAGRAPLLKKSACSHPQGSSVPEKSQIDFVWFEEGTGVALMVNGEVEAVIPPWSGVDNLFGYSANALETDAGTLPLTKENAGLYSRVKANLDYWTGRTSPGFWDNFRDSLLAHYEKAFGPHAQYFALTERQFPTIGIARFDLEKNLSIFATIGMSAQNMPGVEKSVSDPESVMRVEMLSLRSAPEDFFPGLMGRIAVYPWLSGKWIGDEHTFEPGMKKPLTDFFFTRELEAPLDKIGEYSFNNRKTLFLQALAVGQEEILIARARGVKFVLDKLRRS